ncbi:MAG: type II secretion system protein GspL, partial [Rubrivivax sp.]
MAVLVIQVPPRPRLGSRAAGEPAALRAAAEFDYVFSADGRSVQSVGRAAPTGLPFLRGGADSVVAVLADADVAWHRIGVPKAPAARLRAALAGVMEEALLDDDEALHFALPPQATPGQPAWVAVLHKPWLQATLAALEAAGLVVDRVLPAMAPGGTAQGHFQAGLGDDADAAPVLALVHGDGAAVVRSGGSLA